MFTGIVEGTARVREMRRAVPGRPAGTAGARLVLDTDSVLDGGPLRTGESIAVNGVCLTAVAVERGAFAADLSPETLARTTLGRLAPGAAVNLERPVPVTGRLGGHIVQGHVDGVGRVVALRDEAEGRWLEIAAPRDLARYVVDKGSIAVDGVSLTVAGMTGRGFGVALVPHTCAVSTLGSLEPGSEVNLEVDILAKYVERLAPAPALRHRVPAGRAGRPSRGARGRRRRTVRK
ncbi:MAG TPA: riboflavin synthase [bacterium]|nr:riboflavin synthase [bacterium]